MALIVKSFSAKAELSKTRQLLGYREESAGRLMTPEYLAIRPERTIGRALEHIRQHGKDAETINMIYGVDHRGKPILEEPSEAVAMAMDRRFVALFIPLIISSGGNSGSQMERCFKKKLK